MNSLKLNGHLITSCICVILLMFTISTLSAEESSPDVITEWEMATSCWQALSTKIYNMNLKVYSDPDIDLSSYKTYSIDYTNKENRLLEKELFKMVETAIAEAGHAPKLVRSDENPDILITMDFYTGKKEEYVPPKTVFTTRVENVWSSSLFGWGHNTPVPITESHTTEGFTKVSYYRNIRLNFMDFKQLNSGEKLEVPPLVWIGEVDSEGSSSDIRVVAPILLKQLLSEFPEKSGRILTGRIQRVTTYGYVGISVDSEDRRIIRRIDPGSPAERAGFKVGDKITNVKMTGEKLKPFSGKQDWVITKKMKNWWEFQISPYFRCVISNTNNRSISFAGKRDGKFIKNKQKNKQKYWIEVIPEVKSTEWFYK